MDTFLLPAKKLDSSRIKEMDVIEVGFTKDDELKKAASNIERDDVGSL